MSKYETKDNSGSLFKNARKEKDTQPDYQGECKIAGVEYYMSAWLKTSESGRKWMSFSFKTKEQKQEKPAAKQSHAFDDMDSDIPF